MATTARTERITGHIGPNWSQEVSEFVEGRAWNVRFRALNVQGWQTNWGLKP